MSCNFGFMDADLLRKRIREKLFEKDLSMTQAEKLGDLKDGSLRQFMSGRTKNPTLDTLNRVAGIFEISLSNLLDESIIPNYAEKKKLLWNDEVFKKIVFSLSSFMKNNKTPINSEEAFNILRNFYYFYSEKDNHEVEKAFEGWLLIKMAGKD